MVASAGPLNPYPQDAAVLSMPAAATNHSAQTTFQGENFGALIAQANRVRASDDGDALHYLRLVENYYYSDVNRALQAAGSQSTLNLNPDKVDANNLKENIGILHSAAVKARNAGNDAVADKLGSTRDVLKGVLKVHKVNQDIKQLSDSVKKQLGNKNSIKVTSYVSDELISLYKNNVDSIEIDQRSFGLAKASKISQERVSDISEFIGRLKGIGYKDSMVESIRPKLTGLAVTAQLAGWLEHDLDKTAASFEVLFKPK